MIRCGRAKNLRSYKQTKYNPYTRRNIELVRAFDNVYSRCLWRKSREYHELTENIQGKYQYVMGPYSDPVLHIHPGDRVVVETVDAFEGVIKTEEDLPSQKLVMPFVNPQCGPILVEGAEKGDVVAIYIQSIIPRGHNPRGTVCLIPRFGGLTSTEYTATFE